MKTFSEIALIESEVLRGMADRYAKHLAAEEGREKHNDDDCMLRRRGNV